MNWQPSSEVPLQIESRHATWWGSSPSPFRAPRPHCPPDQRQPQIIGLASWCIANSHQSKSKSDISISTLQWICCCQREYERQQQKGSMPSNHPSSVINIQLAEAPCQRRQRLPQVSLDLICGIWSATSETDNVSSMESINTSVYVMVKDAESKKGEFLKPIMTDSNNEIITLNRSKLITKDNWHNYS